MSDIRFQAWGTDINWNEVKIEFRWNQQDLEIIKKLSPEESLKYINETYATKVSLQNDFILKHTTAKYSECEIQPISDFNTIVSINIPYVLHVPNDGYRLLYPKECVISTNKVRTSKAQKSYNFEAIADKALYYWSNDIISATRPYDLSEWRERDIQEVQNAEKLYETTWSLRFTNMVIELNTALTDEFNSDKINDVISEVISITNHVLLLYKKASKAYHIRSLNNVFVNYIYLVKENCWVYIVNLNVRCAKINESRAIIDQFTQDLLNGTELPNYILTLLSAKSNFASLEDKLAIVESFQLIDILIEKLIYNYWNKNWFTIEEVLINWWGSKFFTTKNGLRFGLITALWSSFEQIDNDLFLKRTTLYDNIRNNVIHKEYSATHEEAKECLEINEQLMILLENKLSIYLN